MATVRLAEVTDLTGPTDRSYADQFLNHGVALIGPWEMQGRGVLIDPMKSLKAGSSGGSPPSCVPADVLLLRMGLSTIRAVGLVASEYQYLPQFDDVMVGLASCAHGDRFPTMGGATLVPDSRTLVLADRCSAAHPPRLSRVGAAEIVDYANGTSFGLRQTDWQDRALPSLPEEEAELEAPPIELQEIVDQVHDLLSLYSRIWMTIGKEARPSSGNWT